MSLLPLHKTAFDRKATPRWVLNAIVTQICIEALRDGRGRTRLCKARGATIREGDDQMNTQTSNKAGFVNNVWVQMAALAVVTVVIIALAAKYIW